MYCVHTYREGMMINKKYIMTWKSQLQHKENFIKRTERKMFKNKENLNHKPQRWYGRDKVDSSRREGDYS